MRGEWRIISNSPNCCVTMRCIGRNHAEHTSEKSIRRTRASRNVTTAASHTWPHGSTERGQRPSCIRSLWPSSLYSRQREVISNQHHEIHIEHLAAEGPRRERPVC